MRKKQPRIVAAAVGNCVHVAGTISFLRLAEQCGYETHFLGPAVAIEKLLENAKKLQANVIGVSYRLTPSVAERLFAELETKAKKLGLKKKCRFVCGCTPAVAKVAQKFSIFERIFTGEEPIPEVLAYLRGENCESKDIHLGSTLLERWRNKKPYPLVRHHFGLPDLEATVEGVAEIAEARVLDVISLGPDQNAQFAFFRPDEMDPNLEGGGGVPVRTHRDMERIYEAAQRGNYPLLRCYSGTRDLLKWAELNLETIRNAWAAIPLCWYSVLDGRSNRPLRDAIAENQEAMKWHAERGIPVEVNEAHHWSLRDAPDVVAVVMAYLAAYNAKAMGVKHYVAQYMFNTPNGSWYSMDIAKMLAKVTLIESLHDDSFSSLRQVRTGLTSLSPNMNVAKGQLASSIHLAMSLKPDIVHVVGFSEADHAATPADVIESCQIINGVIRNTLYGLPSVEQDPQVIRRKEELLEEAQILLDAIKSLGSGTRDPYTDPEVIAKAVKIGLLDAPHLRGNQYAAGAVATRLIDGKCLAVDPDTNRPLSETERIERLLTAGAVGTATAD